MTFTLGIMGAGQLVGQFAALFNQHTGISALTVTDTIFQRPLTRCACLLHRSALRGGERLAIPDFGAAPQAR